MLRHLSECAWPPGRRISVLAGAGGVVEASAACDMILPMKLGRAGKVELLAAVPLFARCSKRDLATIARLAQELSLPAGHVLIHEQAAVAYSFFVLVDGAAEVSREGSVLATLGPGDFVGEMALILRRPRTATVTLTAPSRLLSISAHHFRPMLMDAPEVQFKLLEALAERLAPIEPPAGPVDLSG